MYTSQPYSDSCFHQQFESFKKCANHPFRPKIAGLDEGWMLYSQRPDKDWGLTDCISFAVMTQEGITQAFTSDRHFEQAGFTKLL